MKPVSHGAVELISMSKDLFGELVHETGEHIIERQGVCGHVNPARFRCENSEGLAGPQSVALFPHGDIGLEFFSISVQVRKVEFPLGVFSAQVEVLFKNAKPFGTGDTFFEGLDNLSSVHVVHVQLSCELNVTSELLIGLVVSVVEWATLQIDNTSKSIEVVDSSCSGNFSTEAVTANGCKSNFLIVHESNNIVAKIVHIVRWMMVGATLVSVIKHPHISHGGDLVFGVREEFREVFCRLDQFR